MKTVTVKYAGALIAAGALLASAGASATPVYYDSARKAIAVNTYHDSFGGSIYVDFDADHGAYRSLDQIYTVYRSGTPYKLTSLGHVGSSGPLTSTRFGTHLEDPGSIRDFSFDFVNTVGGTTQRTRFFTDNWNPSNGNTWIFLQALDAQLKPIDIDFSSLGGIFYKVGRRDQWTSVADIYKVSEPGTLGLLGMGIAGLGFVGARRRRREAAR